MTVGKTLLVCTLAGASIVAIFSGRRIGWTNYWGGFIYAPIALAIAVLAAIAFTRRRRRARAGGKAR